VKGQEMKAQRWINVLITLALVVLLFGEWQEQRPKAVSMAIESSSVSDYIKFASPPATIVNQTQRTYSAYVYTTGDNTVGSIHAAFTALDNVSTIRVAFGIILDATYNRLEFDYLWSTGTGQWYTNSYTFAHNTWYHIAVTYNNTSTANDPILYVNGIAQAITEGHAPTGVVPVETEIRIARNKIRVAGLMEFNRILSAAEVLAIYEGRGCDNIYNGLVFAPLMYGAAGLQAFDGATLAAGNKVVDPFSGATGTPSGSPVGAAETYLCVGQ
jgi:hypothetical protein